MAGLSSIQQPRTHLEQSNEASPEPSLCQAKTPVFSRVPCLTGFPNGMVLRKWTPVGPGIDHSLSRWVLGSTEEQRTLASPSLDPMFLLMWPMAASALEAALSLCELTLSPNLPQPPGVGATC